MRPSSSYRARIIYTALATIIAFASLVFGQRIAREMRDKEQKEIRLWATSFDLNSPDEYYNEQNRMIQLIIGNTTAIPAVITDEYLNVVSSNIDPEITGNPDKLREKLKEMCLSGHAPIEFRSVYSDKTFTVYYDDSTLLKSIYMFPYVQLGLIIIFISFAYMTILSSKQNEQNRIWVGMAKETAHQLGTPTSSLLGWVEYIRNSGQLPEVADEMEKDIERLKKVADRFGKIGSSTQLSPMNVYDIVAKTVAYFRVRIPKNVTLNFEMCSADPLQAMINESLFDWVIENLMKNALDALQGKGEINVSVKAKDKWIHVDVQDTGKGMPRSQFKRIFQPGYSTKTRGWGLGLSLSKRIIGEYHNGKIFVRESVVGKGSTFRVSLKKI